MSSPPWSVSPSSQSTTNENLNFWVFEQKTFFLETAFLNAKAAQLCYPIVSEWDQCQDEFHFRKYHRVNTKFNLILIHVLVILLSSVTKISKWSPTLIINLSRGYCNPEFSMLVTDIEHGLCWWRFEMLTNHF